MTGVKKYDTDPTLVSTYFETLKFLLQICPKLLTISTIKVHYNLVSGVPRPWALPYPAALPKVNTLKASLDLEQTQCEHEADPLPPTFLKGKRTWA